MSCNHVICHLQPKKKNLKCQADTEQWTSPAFDCSWKCCCAGTDPLLSLYRLFVFGMWEGPEAAPPCCFSRRLRKCASNFQSRQPFSATMKRLDAKLVKLTLTDNVSTDPIDADLLLPILSFNPNFVDCFWIWCLALNRGTISVPCLIYRGRKETLLHGHTRIWPCALIDTGVQ